MRRMVMILVIFIFTMVLSACGDKPLYSTTCNYTGRNDGVEQEVFVYGERVLFEYYVDGELVGEDIENYRSLDATEWVEIKIETAKEWESGEVCVTTEVE